MLVDPADLRFTQDSISLHFQPPYSHFTIREAVRRISQNDMTPDEFPFIRVISYDGCLWSVDNRRLWVFRFARCRSISVRLEESIHPRLCQIISSPGLLRKMKGAGFFPRVRDRGRKDLDFDLRYPQPSSFQPSKNSDYTVINMAQEDTEPFEFLPNLCGRGDTVWTFNRLDARLSSSQAEIVDFFPKASDRGHTNGDSDRLGPQPSSCQASRSDEYTMNKAQDFVPKVHDNEETHWDFHRLHPHVSLQSSGSHERKTSKAQEQAEGVDFVPKARTGGDTREDKIWDFNRLGAGLSSFQAEGIDFFPKASDRRHRNGDADSLGPQPSSFQPSRSHDYTINKAQEHADCFPKVHDSEDEDWDFHRRHPQVSPLQPSGIHDYTTNKAEEQAEGVDFGPNARAGGDTDQDFDRLHEELSDGSFPPSRIHDYTISKAQEDPENQYTSVTGTPYTLSTSLATSTAESTAREQANNKITSGTASSETPWTSTVRKHPESQKMSGTASPQTQSTSTALNIIWSAAKTTIHLAGMASSQTVKVAKKVFNAFWVLFHGVKVLAMGQEPKN